MKHIYFIIAVFILLSCRAQSSVIDIASKNRPDNLNGVYLKDTNNILNKFTGTWKYTNGSTSLIITLIKKEQIFNGRWYNDQLLGEYKYIENGVEIVDYLPRLNDSNVRDGQHSIRSKRLVNNDYRIECTDCAPGEKRVLLRFRDFDRRYLPNQILVQYINTGGTEKLKIRLNSSAVSIVPSGGSTQTRVPYGEYTLTKQ